MTIHAFSYGGGVQSTAALVLAVQGKIPPRLFVFANVGADSENPPTLEYLETIAKPYAARQGIELVTVQRQEQGQPVTLLPRAQAQATTVYIPMRFSPSGVPGPRSCTGDFKIKPIAYYLRDTYGATAADPATVHLGISLDEIGRMSNKTDHAYIRKAYPLIDLRLTRGDCRAIIAAAGLPIPPRSSCWFCPFHTPVEWRRMKNEERPLFDAAVALESEINVARDAAAQDRVFLTRRNKPLDQAIAGEGIRQLALLEDDDACESGYCMI